MNYLSGIYVIPIRRYANTRVYVRLFQNPMPAQFGNENTIILQSCFKYFAETRGVCYSPQRFFVTKQIEGLLFGPKNAHQAKVGRVGESRTSRRSNVVGVFSDAWAHRCTISSQILLSITIFRIQLISSTYSKCSESISISKAIPSIHAVSAPRFNYCNFLLGF